MTLLKTQHITHSQASALSSLLTMVVFVGAYCFWHFCYPQALCYQEQNQLFLWTCSYFCHDIALAGGMADYVSEFLVQFYYLPWAGALILGVLFALMQKASFLLLDSYPFLKGRLWTRLLGSMAVPLAMLLVMGDIEVLLSFPVAITMSLFAAWAMNRANAKWGNRFCCSEIMAVPAIYWLVGGGAAWLYIVLRGIFLVTRCKQWIPSLLSSCYLLGVQLIAYNTVLTQYPLTAVMAGINYYRVPEQLPGRKWGYDKDLYALLKLNEQVRYGRWNEIISDAEEYQVTAPYTSNCVNLALANTRQLADRMFNFFQSGEDALLSGHTADNMSTYPTMEAFWQLGLVNSSLRYACDLQESILNDKGSGRLVKRMAQCYIVNGNDRAARKQLALLKHSLFYKDWAEEAEKMVGNKAAISHDPEMGRAMRMRFKDDFLYSYGEVDKIMGLLFVNNPDNRMALDYFMGEMLLKGNIKGFTQYMGWVQQYGGYASMPLGYQDALRCIQSRGNAPGSAYAEYAKRMMMQQHNGGGKE